MSHSLLTGAPVVNPLTQQCGIGGHIQDSITVIETHDDDGDLEYLLNIRTHSRAAIDLLAATFGVDVEFLREEVRDGAD